MLSLQIAKDNDFDGYLENLASGLTLSVFVATANTQAATALHAELTMTPAFGVYDIPALNGNPARPGVSAYKFTLEGSAITAHLGAYIGAGPLYLLVREGQNIRRWAELEVLEDLPLEAP